MPEKLPKNVIPTGHSLDDFECFGPVATVDGQFDGTKLADLGCFTQDGKDSNKSYNACVTKSKKNGGWFAYFEWGRTGAAKRDFQFVECDSETEAEQEYADQLHSKNDKRGEWATIGGIKTLRAKSGKDCYLVRGMAVRTTGLPDAQRITSNDGAKKQLVKTVTTAPKGKPSNTPSVDQQTIKLMKDLNVATVNYAKTSMATASLPTQVSIDDARKVLVEAQKRIVKVGDDEQDQLKDGLLKDLTNVLYSKIPKIKPIGAPPSSWLLSKNNIFSWQSDLDAFESALYSGTVSVDNGSDPFGGMSIDMSWIDPESSIGTFLTKWAPKATRGKHGYGQMKIHNMWKVVRHGDEDRLAKCQEAISKENKGRHKETPLHQPDKMPWIEKEKMGLYRSSHTTLLFHGTRSINVSGILRKSFLLPTQLVGVVVTGAMFGGGIYSSDDWMKSAGYSSLSSSYWSNGGGKVPGRHAFMFICDVVLGNPHLAKGPSGYTHAPKGTHSVFGKAGYSGVQNNEFIVYRSEQQIIRYLIEFSA